MLMWVLRGSVVYVSGEKCCCIDGILDGGVGIYSLGHRWVVLCGDGQAGWDLMVFGGHEYWGMWHCM